MQQAKFAQKSTLNKIADFSVELLKNTMTSQENILISPVSLLAVLVMAMRGAKGNTLRELEEVIGTDAETLSGYFASFFADDAEASQQSMPEREKQIPCHNGQVQAGTSYATSTRITTKPLSRTGAL